MGCASTCPGRGRRLVVQFRGEGEPAIAHDGDVTTLVPVGAERVDDPFGLARFER